MVQPYRPGLLERLLGDLFRVVNRRIVWHRLGFLLSVVNLVALRTNPAALQPIRHRNPRAGGAEARGPRRSAHANAERLVQRPRSAEHGHGRHAVRPQRSDRQYVPRPWEASSTPIRG